jgi:hypothetical protein
MGYGARAIELLQRYSKLSAGVFTTMNESAILRGICKAVSVNSFLKECHLKKKEVARDGERAWVLSI